MVDLVVAFILVAAIAKLADVPEFGRSLLTWKYIPHAAITPLAYGVPLVELSLALLWFLRLGPRTAVVGVGLLLVLFTSVFLYHVRDPGPPPDCGCLGKIIQYESQQAAITGLVTRNGALFGLLVVGAWIGGVFRSPPVAGHPIGSDEIGWQRGAVRAFTLIEVIFVIAIIALLVSLLMPALGGVRQKARDAKTLSNLRTHATNMASYTSDWQGQFPYMTDPELDATEVIAGGQTFEVSYWGAAIVWPLGLLDSYYDGNLAHPSLIEKQKDVAQAWGMWAYTYSSSFLARPEFWNPKTREGVHQLRPTTMGDVRYPSQKGILIPGDDQSPENVDFSFRPTIGARVGFVDTSARFVGVSEFLPWYTSGEYPYGSASSMIGFPITHTIDGVRGRDIK